MIKEVFILHHTYGSDKEEDDNWKELGIYSSRPKAWNAIRRFRKKPGFKEYPKGFLISKYILDKDDGCLEGFITWEEALKE
ncbi:MAG: hypothetical protein FJX18_07055 [Alphaproteobacteria bacterium]|nr:hypothetical protein [Alphaproteobacteria bacterium]